MDYTDSLTLLRRGMATCHQSTNTYTAMRPKLLHAAQIPSHIAMRILYWVMRPKIRYNNENPVLGSSTPWLLELKEEELLIMRIKAPQNNADGEIQEKIPKEEAVCKVCFHIFTKDNALKIKCGCKFTLLHENCINQIGSSKCKVCDQDTQYIPVMPTRANNENPSASVIRSSNWMWGCFRSKA